MLLPCRNYSVEIIHVEIILKVNSKKFRQEIDAVVKFLIFIYFTQHMLKNFECRNYSSTSVADWLKNPNVEIFLPLVLGPAAKFRQSKFIFISSQGCGLISTVVKILQTMSKKFCWRNLLSKQFIRNNSTIRKIKLR